MSSSQRRTAVLCVVTVTLAVCSAGVARASLTTGLVGDWPLDEGQGTVTVDHAGVANNGTLSGSVTWVPGRFGTALNFNGATGQVEVTDSATLEPPSTVSVSAWVKNLGSPGSYKYVIAKGATACIAAGYGLYTGAQGGLEFYVSRNSGQFYADSPDAGTGVWDGRWHLAVGTFDGTTVRLYVDGVQVGSGTVYPGPLQYLQPNSNDFFIGNYPGCTDHEFTGTIDDVMVWSRALSSDEASALVTSPEILSVPGSAGSGSGGGAGSGAGSSTRGGSASGGGSGAGPGSGTSGTLPAISRLHVSPAIVRTRRLTAHRRRTTVTISYADTQPARTTLVLLRRRRGFRRNGACVSGAVAHAPRARACTRWVPAATAAHSDRAGANRYALTVLLRHLMAGTYRLELTPRSASGTGRRARVILVVRW